MLRRSCGRAGLSWSGHFMATAAVHIGSTYAFFDDSVQSCAVFFRLNLRLESWVHAVVGCTRDVMGRDVVTVSSHGCKGRMALGTCFV